MDPAVGEKCLFIGLFEPAQQLVAGCDGIIQTLLGRFLAGEDGFQFTVVDVADLNIIPEAQSLRILCRFLQRHLFQSGFHTWVFFISPLLLGQFVSRQGDRQITGKQMPVGLDLGEDR